MTDNAPNIEELISTFRGDLGKAGEAIEHHFNTLNGQVAALTEIVGALLNAAPTEVHIRAISQLQKTQESMVTTKEAAITFALWEERLKKGILLP